MINYAQCLTCNQTVQGTGAYSWAEEHKCAIGCVVVVKEIK